VHLNKKSNTQDVVEQSLTILRACPFLFPVSLLSLQNLEKNEGSPHVDVDTESYTIRVYIASIF